jgi:lambda family phage portal protein
VGIFSSLLSRLGYERKETVREQKRRAAQSVIQSWLGPSWSQSMLGVGGSLGLSGYYSTDPRRKVGDPIQEVGGTLNQLLGGDLYRLARQLRQLDRNNASIRAIIEGHLADLIGTGIGVAPDTGDEDLNQRIKAEWDLESDRLGVCGESDTELQRLWCREIDVAGNALGRVVPDAQRPPGYAPISILPLEVEWLSPVGEIKPGNSFCAGVEFDGYGRPVAYHLCDPNGNGTVERVDASLIIHGFERKRAQQAVGEPRLCAVIERALQRARLIDSELRSAVNASTLSTFLKSPYHHDVTDEGDTDSAGESVYLTEFPLGTHANLAPGDEIGVVKSDRPNMEVQDFARALDGDIAAAASSSRVWLDRDGSQYNFANSRFDQIRTNMLVRPYQMWFGKACAGRVYEIYLPFILARLGISPRPGISRYRLQPDIPQETDEKASADALARMQASGVTTRDDWLSQRGKDWRKIAEQAHIEQLESDAQAVNRIKAISEKIKEAGLDIPLATALAVAGTSGAIDPGTLNSIAFGSQAKQPEAEDADVKEQEEQDEESRILRLVEARARVAQRKPISFKRDERTGLIVGAE